MTKKKAKNDYYKVTNVGCVVVFLSEGSSEKWKTESE